MLVLRQLKMIENQTQFSRPEQRSIVKFLVIEKYNSLGKHGRAIEM